MYNILAIVGLVCLVTAGVVAGLYLIAFCIWLYDLGQTVKTKFTELDIWRWHKPNYFATGQYVSNLESTISKLAEKVNENSMVSADAQRVLRERVHALEEARPKVKKGS